MKKFSIIIFIIIIACLFITSCNSDSEHGLYQQISTSSKISSIKISDLLFVDGSDYYYYNDTGIHKFDGTNHKTLVANNSNLIVSGAYIKSATDIFFIDKSGQLYHYDGTKYEPIKKDTAYTVLFANGYIRVKSGELYFIEDQTKITKISTENTSEEKIYEDYISFKDGKDTTYKLFKKTTQEATITEAHIGFVVDNSIVYLIKDTGLYRSGNTEKLIEFKNSKQENGKVPAFAVNGKIYLKFGNEFIIYNISDKKAAEITKGWASNIATASMIDCKNGKYISTNQNGLFKIDLEKNQNTKIF